MDTATIADNGMPMRGLTLVMRKGGTVTVNVTTSLADDTTTHWHGVHLPPDVDGGPLQVIVPGANWSPTWTLNHNDATYWHHPHAHELTWTQLDMGAGGFIIVRDDEEGGRTTSPSGSTRVSPSWPRATTLRATRPHSRTTATWRTMRTRV